MSNVVLLFLHPDEITTANRETLRRLLYNYQILVTRDSRHISQQLPDITVAAGWLSPENARLMPNLQWLHHWAAGIDNFMDDPTIMARDFMITTSSGIHGIPVSEHVFAYILAFAREYPAAIRAQSRHQWSVPSHPTGNTMFELGGKTMLIIGMGAIGKRVAIIAKAFGIHVIGIRQDPTKLESSVDRILGPQDLSGVLPQADFVVLTVPLTPATRNIIDERELHLMKSSAYLINVGRGQLIRENALISALQKGWIAGAGLDVFNQEPLSHDSPLWDMDNVIITAHYAGNTPCYNERAMELFLLNVQRYVIGAPLLNLVDRDLGY
jgi:phosphoglycerate dehydrogenase-like enzyme